MNLNGIFCPIVTPFRHDQDLYTVKVLHNIARLNEINLTGYIVGSETGEGSLLSFEEKLELLDLVAQATKKTKIIATSEPGVRNAVRLIEEAAHRGYEAAIVESKNEFLIRCIQDQVSIPVITESITAPPLTNVVPYVFQTIFEAERSREAEAAEDWRQRVTPGIAAIEKFGVAGIKAAMDRFGYYGGPPRLPNTALSLSQLEEIAIAFDGLKS